MDVSSFWNPKGDATPGGGFNPGSSGYWDNQPTTPQYGSGGGSGWTNAFRAAGQALDAFGRNRRDEGAYDWNRGGGFTGGGVEQKGDLTFVYPQQQAPYTIQGQQSGFSRLAGAAAPFAALIPGVGPFISAGLGAASSFG